MAERILFGSTLDDKLTPPELSGTRPIEIPPTPGRPNALSLGRGRSRFEFPTRRELETEVGRGRALHFFANHELLALELMALMILRFPDADRFRRQLAGTIIDEQRHLLLYLDRMRALGVELGDVRVNDYFWRAMKDVPSPVAFIAAMSLTFEQANLDFSKHYAGACRAIGDETTASILEEVYEDEIRHVRAGVRFMSEHSEGDLFLAYEANLFPPLTPARAKGPVFDVEGRQRAGLDERFIRSLSVYARSKGRRPRLFVFDAACEDSIAHAATGSRSYTPPKEVLEIERDLSPLLGFLASKDDEVLVPEAPSLDHLERLTRAGFTLPRFVTRDELGGTFEVVGWGTGPRVRALSDSGEAHHEFSRVVEGSGVASFAEGNRLRSTERSTRTRRSAELFSKAFGARMLDEVRTLPEIAAIVGPEWSVGVERSGKEEVRARVEELFALGVQKVVAKALYSASGRHRVFFERGRSLDAPAEGWLRDRTVIVEPWLERVRDLSIVVEGSDKAKVLEMLTDARGRYKGHRLGNAITGLDLEDLFRRGDLFRAIRAVVDHVRAAVPFPFFGVDALLYRHDGRLYLQPIVEVNPRLTMGHVAAALARRLAPRTAARWLHLDASEVDREALARSEVTISRGRIANGRIATNDPMTAQHVVTVLDVRGPKRPLGSGRLSE